MTMLALAPFIPVVAGAVAVAVFLFWPTGMGPGVHRGSR